MTVEITGPLLDGTAAAATVDFMEESVETLAERGAELVRDGSTAFRNPTGAYRAAIRAEERPGGYAVTDGGLVYGPWLAGTTRRNQTTGFRGYDHWEDAARALDSDLVRIVTPYLNGYRRKLGGRR